MKITRVESWKVPVRLEVPYAVAYGHFEEAELVFLRLETDTGLIGYGSAGCDPEVTGETADTVLHCLKGFGEAFLRGRDSLLIEQILGELKLEWKSQPSALATVDMALFDLLGKQLDIPLWKYFGACRDRIKTSITIGILPELETMEFAECWIKKGFQCLKIKGGHNVELDMRRVRSIRERFGTDIELRFDANQGYSVDDAIRFVEETAKCNITIFEQPTGGGRPELFGKIRGCGSASIMADESIKDAADAYQLAKNGYVDSLNIKLMKCGGLLEALQIEAIGRAANLELMIGCMDESALGIAAGLHLALGRPAIKFADLDGHIGLLGDPAANGLRLEDGYLYPPDGPGLGIEPRFD